MSDKTLIRIICGKNSCLLSFGLGLTTYLAFAPHYVVPIFWINLVCMWLMCDKYNSYKKTIQISYCYLTAYFISALYGIANVFLYKTPYADFFGFLVAIAIGLWLALFGIVPFIVWQYFMRHNHWIKILSFAATWVLSEAIQTYVFANNRCGAMFAFSPILSQLASLGGVYLLSFLNILLAGSLYIFYTKHLKSSVIVFVTILACMILFGTWRINTYTFENSNIKIRLVQPTIEQQNNVKQPYENYIIDQHIKLQKETTDDIDFLIWGESALTFDPETHPYTKNKIKDFIPKKGYFITGISHYEKNEIYDSLWVFDKKVNRIATYNKYHLMSYGGEYLPFRKYLPKPLRNISNVSGTDIDFKKGDKYKTIHIAHYPPFGALICYDIFYPGEVVNRSDPPQWLILLLNSSWFAKSTESYLQLASAQMRAIEEGLTVVQCAKFGISAIIDPTGRIQSQLKLGEKGVLDMHLPKQLTMKTLYSRIGNKLTLTIMFLILGLAIFMSKKEKLIQRFLR